MDELQTKILALVDQNGGQVLYQTVYDACTPTELQLLPKALKRLRDLGEARPQNVFDKDAGTTTFYVRRMGSGA